MRRIFHFLSILILAGLLTLGFGRITGLESMGDGAHQVAVSDIGGHGTGHHDHGSGGNGGKHHCTTVSCVSGFVVLGNRAGSTTERLTSKWDTPFEETHIRPAYLEQDPPVPRFSI